VENSTEGRLPAMAGFTSGMYESAGRVARPRLDRQPVPQGPARDRRCVRDPVQRNTASPLIPRVRGIIPLAEVYRCTFSRGLSLVRVVALR
jgi:hypothetical protein